MRAETPVLSPYLTEDEINGLCKPLKQRFAQRRYIERVLGIAVAGVRPDGLPLVGRTIVEERLNNKAPSPARRGFNWSK
ncbi:hypothetical protein [Delftia acidovorans]